MRQDETLAIHDDEKRLVALVLPAAPILPNLNDPAGI